MATLYRFHAADDSLLYVGITATGLQRVRGHASKSHWWPHVARATFESVHCQSGITDRVSASGGARHTPDAGHTPRGGA